MARKGIEPMHDEHVNVTPLIDVVMCLIVFFLMVSKLVKDEMVEMVIPRANVGLEMEDQMGRLTINVVPPPLKDKDGNEIPEAQRKLMPPTVKMHGQDMITGDGWKALTARLRDERRLNPDLKVILRADENEKYDWIGPVLVACAQADIKNVNFATRQGQ
ncbi:MAG: biopolymer transporter ExbD [Phycisphaerales bacterium]|nr:biopolymer transporter ExbD [Phycisphaerales bacterium]